MESYYAHIENNIVVSVEVVTDKFVKANSNRYQGVWLKVGNGSKRAFCGKDCIYLPDKDKIISPKPFDSWILDKNDEWQAPEKKLGDDYSWDEKLLNWIKL